MEFYTASRHSRPVRLPDPIRQWAWDSLHGKYGDEAVACPAVVLDDIPNIRSMPQQRQLDMAILQIAQNAPLRICPQETICGAATLGQAIRHRIPATLDGEIIGISNSHLTLNFYRVIHEGLDSYTAELEQRLTDPSLTERQRSVLAGMQNVIDAIRIWHRRYLEATKEIKPAVHNRLLQVPFGPARDFHEAVQSLWFIFAFVRLCGNWPGIGRIDWILGDYLRRDLDSGKLTPDEARCILANLFIKGCEWIESDTVPGTGDAQHYQNIVLAGIDENGVEVANEVTDLVLDVVEELSISDFPITVRINENTPDALLQHIAEVMRHGGGIVAVYNEPLILRAMERAGYPLKDARHFANDGCWEVQVPGATNFGYIPFDGLQLLEKALGLAGDSAPAFTGIEEIYQAFLSELKSTLERQYQAVISNPYVYTQEDGWLLPGDDRSIVVSLFEDGCIEKARTYNNLGPVYAVRSPHIGGAPDIANSLYAIQKLVFEENRVTLPQLISILRNNWEGEEPLRQYVRNRYTYYGNDSEADTWLCRVLQDFAVLVDSCKQENTAPVKFVPGVSTFGRQIDWLPARSATAFGARKGDILAGNDSPTPGTDLNGATAIIRSYCKANHELLTTGSALDIKLQPSVLDSDSGIPALVALIRSFVQLGGFFMQLDVMDPEVLRAAQQDPMKYKTLSVRVSGWNARFVTLQKEWQEMIIHRTAQEL